MAIEPGLGDRQPWWPHMVAAAVLVLAPISIGAVLFFGGSRVNQCLAMSGCPGMPQPEAIPVIGTTEGWIAVVVALGAIWLVAAGLTVRYLWSRDRTRLIRAAAVTTALVVTTAAVVALLRLVDGQRLRVVAEDAGLYALGALILVVPLVLAWAILTAHLAHYDPASRQTVTPSMS